MFRLKPFLILTFIPIPLLLTQVFAKDLSPSAEVKKNIIVLTQTKSCLNCDLSGGNLNRLDLEGANLAGANLSRSTMALTNLSNANLQNADLREAVFTGADLSDTNMRGADLTGASFAGAYMVGALMDGEMLSTKPYEKDDISDVEESVYVEDTVKSKAPQKTDELTIGSRRDFEETPPVVPAKVLSQKTIQDPPVAVLVEEHSTSETNIDMAAFSKGSVVAPAAKAVPAMNEVRLRDNENVVPEELPIIEENKKEKSSEVITKILEEQEAISDDNGTVKVLEKERVIDTSTTDISKKENKLRVKSQHNNEAITNNSLPVERTQPKVESQEIPVNTESIVVADPIETESESVPHIDDEVTTVDTENEDLQEMTNESSGILQKVLNIFSSAEASSEILKNVSILLDTKSCYGCNLQGANLSGENLDGVDLEGADLSNAILKDVDFEEANLKGANLTGADLTGADLSEADLYKADFSKANLTDANFEKALIDDTNFTGAIGYNISNVMLFEMNN